MWALATLAVGATVCGALMLLICRYTALGDSLAAGVGSLTFYGYVPRLAWKLAWRKKRLVWPANLGRFGMTSGELLEALRRDERFRRAVRRARLITVNIGGNDLLRCRYQEDCLRAAIPRFRANWEAILAQIRVLNPTAAVLTMTLYNPAPEGDIRRPLFETFIAEMNGIITAPHLLRHYRVTAVPVDRAFAGRECELTWFCRIGDIHATDAGYGVIADLLLAHLP